METIVTQSIISRELGLISSYSYQTAHMYDRLKTLEKNTILKFQPSYFPVLEIIPTPSLLFIINSNHRCLCFSKFGHKFKFELTTPSEHSRTIYYNRHQNAVILVVVITDQQDTRLKCRSYNLMNLEQGNLEPVTLFPDEDLRNPGFIEFDDANRFILTKAIASTEYKLWRLQDYKLHFSIKEPNVEEIRLTNELIMLIHSPRETSVMCKLCSANTGTVLDVYDIKIKPNRMIELLELFSNFMLVKQYGEPLLIINLLTLEKVEIRGFVSPQNFIYLYECQLFLALRTCVIEVWNFEGKLLKIFGAPVIAPNRGLIPNRLFISRNQDLILISCSEQRNIRRNISGANNKTTIRIYKLENGELVKEIKEPILDTLTTVTFDEHFENLYTGHSNGEVCKWGY